MGEIVNFRLDEDRKAEWEAYVAGSTEVTSLSHLIRQTVQRRVNGYYDTDPRPSGDAVEVELSGASDVLNDIQDTVHNIDEKLDALDSIASEDIVELATEMYDEIPRGDELVELLIEVGEASMASVATGDSVDDIDAEDHHISDYEPESVMSLSTLAERFDVDRYSAKRAVERLESDMDVITGEYDGETWVFRPEHDESITSRAR